MRTARREAVRMEAPVDAFITIASSYEAIQPTPLLEN
jgi:hypothetical protein